VPKRPPGPTTDAPEAVRPSEAGIHVVAARLCDGPDPEGRYAFDERELEGGTAAQGGHAGLIVQREGRLHGLRPWVEPRLTIGRANTCAIVLPDAGVSRRHASLERRGDVFEVIDLGSVNGTYVNGRRIERHRLRVGDVLRFESFALTFVLDDRPLEELVRGPARALRGTARTGGAKPHGGDPRLERAAEPPLPVADLLQVDPLDDEEKEDVPRSLLTVVSAARRRPAEPVPDEAPATLRLGVTLRGQDLSRRMQLALALLEAEGGTIPAAMTIRVGDSRKR
jgi:hypothetical protein